MENISTLISYTEKITIAAICKDDEYGLGYVNCIKTKDVLKTRIEWNEISSLKAIRQCCAGYSETSSNVCMPICVNGCENGVCIAPNQCKCDEGYVLTITNE